MMKEMEKAQKVLDDNKKAIEDNIRWRVTPPFYGYGFKILNSKRLVDCLLTKHGIS